MTRVWTMIIRVKAAPCQRSLLTRRLRPRPLRKQHRVGIWSDPMLSIHQGNDTYHTSGVFR